MTGLHKFMRAIGFSEKLNRYQIRELLEKSVADADSVSMTEEDGYVFGQVLKEVSPNLGISICGEYNERDELEIDYYFPYFRGTGVTSYSEVSIGRHAAHESYGGICDDIRVGIAAVFFLQNITDYKNGLRLCKYTSALDTSVTLSGLSVSGTILLPVSKSQRQVLATKKADQARNGLIAKAREGDEEAIESLTMEDMDTYSMISRRIQHEDVLTIVDSYFIPNGIECDMYSVMGTILEVDMQVNCFTQDRVFLLRVECKEIIMDICINEKDLLGEPQEGRRFKGIIWLQGRLNYPA